jgi:DNA-binding transcriptional regulator YdaS (Cro superfamily)
MKKFSAWLDQNRGMATAIAKTLGINRANITNAKSGHLLMPTGWMPLIVELSKGEVSYESLVVEREFHRKEKAKLRALSKVSRKNSK